MDENHLCLFDDDDCLKKMFNLATAIIIINEKKPFWFSLSTTVFGFFLFSRLASLFSQMEQNFAFFSNSIQTKLTLVIIKLASFLFNSVNNEKFRRNLPVTKVVVCCCCIVFGNKEFIKVGKS